MTTHKGSCHCGKVQFEVRGAVSKAIDCNCSMCLRKGALLAFVAPGDFSLVAGADSLTEYRFNKHVVQHTFCRVCGVTPFLSGEDMKGNQMKAVNIRCIEGLDLKSVEVVDYDGRSI